MKKQRGRKGKDKRKRCNSKEGKGHIKLKTRNQIYKKGKQEYKKGNRNLTRNRVEELKEQNQEARVRVRAIGYRDISLVISVHVASFPHFSETGGYLTCGSPLGPLPPPPIKCFCFFLFFFYLIQE